MYGKIRARGCQYRSWGSPGYDLQRVDDRFMKFRGNNGLQGVCGWYGILCCDWRGVWKIVDRDRPIEEGRRKKTIRDGKGRNLTGLSPEEHHRPLNRLHYRYHVLTCLSSERDGSAYTSVGEINSTESIPRPGQRAVYLN